jgi:hypothetical protein
MRNLFAFPFLLIILLTSPHTSISMYIARTLHYTTIHHTTPHFTTIHHVVLHLTTQYLLLSTAARALNCFARSASARSNPPPARGVGFNFYKECVSCKDCKEYDEEGECYLQ